MKLRFNLVFGGFVCIVIVGAAVFAPLLAHYNPVLDADLMNAELPPMHNSGSAPTHRAAMFIRASSMVRKYL